MFQAAATQGRVLRGGVIVRVAWRHMRPGRRASSLELPTSSLVGAVPVGNLGILQFVGAHMPLKRVTGYRTPEVTDPRTASFSAAAAAQPSTARRRRRPAPSASMEKRRRTVEMIRG